MRHAFFLFICVSCFLTTFLQKALAQQWYITYVSEQGGGSSTINGVTTPFTWQSPGAVYETAAYETGYGVYITPEAMSTSAAYSVVNQGNITFALKWLNADGTPGLNPPSTVILAVSPYSAVNITTNNFGLDSCTDTVNDGYGDPSTYSNSLSYTYNRNPGDESGYTTLNGELLQHTELIPVQANGGTATYTTNTLTANVSGVANTLDIMANASVNYVNLAIDNRSVTISRNNSAGDWIDPANPLVAHGDTTYSWGYTFPVFIPGSLMPSYVTTMNDNSQTFTPHFTGSWKQQPPPVKCQWYPDNTGSTADNGIWVIGDGGQREESYPFEDTEWTPSPSPVSGYITYSATDSDNATFTGVYNLNIHPFVEPVAKQEYPENVQRIAWNYNTNLQAGLVVGPALAGLRSAQSIGESHTAGYTVSGSVSIALEELAECFGGIFPGTVGGSIGYSSTDSSITTVTVPPSLAVTQNQIEAVYETSTFTRHILDYRQFTPSGETINQWEANMVDAIAFRTITDDGPTSDSGYVWEIFPVEPGNPQTITGPQPWQVLTHNKPKYRQHASRHIGLFGTLTFSIQTGYT